MGGEPWKLSEQNPDAFTLVVFYRGHHCPVCRRYLSTLESAAEDFRTRGVGLAHRKGPGRLARRCRSGEHRDERPRQPARGVSKSGADTAPRIVRDRAHGAGWRGQCAQATRAHARPISSLSRCAAVGLER